MTDKQIIIDVTQCPYYKEDKTCTYLPFKSKCEGDCNWTAYKEMEQKLKAKEQECKTLASQLDFEVQKKECLEQECEELKKIIDEAKNSKLDLSSFFAIEATIGEYCLELDRLKAKNDELMKQHQADKGLITSTGKMNYQLIQEYDKLKNCLAEIKEIAKNGCYDDCGMPLDELSIILQKISECEVE